MSGTWCETIVPSKLVLCPSCALSRKRNPRSGRMWEQLKYAEQISLVCKNVHILSRFSVILRLCPPHWTAVSVNYLVFAVSGLTEYCTIFHFPSPVQPSTAQCRSAQSITAQCSLVQPSTAQYSPVQSTTVQCSQVAAQYIPVQPIVLVNIVSP